MLDLFFSIYFFRIMFGNAFISAVRRPFITTCTTRTNSEYSLLS